MGVGSAKVSEPVRCRATLPSSDPTSSSPAAAMPLQRCRATARDDGAAPRDVAGVPARELVLGEMPACARRRATERRHERARARRVGGIRGESGRARPDPVACAR